MSQESSGWNTVQRCLSELSDDLRRLLMAQAFPFDSNRSGTTALARVCDVGGVATAILRLSSTHDEALGAVVVQGDTLARSPVPPHRRSHRVGSMAPCEVQRDPTYVGTGGDLACGDTRGGAGSEGEV